MNVIVSDIPGDYQAYGRHIKTGRVVGVAMSHFHYNQVVPLEIDHISLELLCDNEPIGDLARKPRAPKVGDELWRGLLVHEFHNIRCRDCSSIWEAFKKSSDSKPMVSMPMRNIDCCQVLAACCYPIH